MRVIQWNGPVAVGCSPMKAIRGVLVADLLKMSAGVGWGDRHVVEPGAAEERRGAGEHGERQLTGRGGDGVVDPAVAEPVRLAAH